MEMVVARNVEPVTELMVFVAETIMETAILFFLLILLVLELFVEVINNNDRILIRLLLI